MGCSAACRPYSAFTPTQASRPPQRNATPQSKARRQKAITPPSTFSTLQQNKIRRLLYDVAFYGVTKVPCRSSADMRGRPAFKAVAIEPKSCNSFPSHRIAEKKFLANSETLVLSLCLFHSSLLKANGE